MKYSKTKYSKTVQLSTLFAISVFSSTAVVPEAFAFGPVAEFSGAEMRSPRLSARRPRRLISQFGGNTQRERDAFFDSDYTYDDAVVLAEFWGQSIDDSKARIGRKILWGGENIAVLENYLEDAKEQAETSESADNPGESSSQSEDTESVDQSSGELGGNTQRERDAFLASQYTTEDALVLSEFWGKSFDESQNTIGRKILWGEDNVAILDENLEDAWDAAVEGQPAISDPTAYCTEECNDRARLQNLQIEQEAFTNSDYTYWDAAVLAGFWEQSVGTSKIMIGRKLFSGGENAASIEGRLEEAQAQAMESVEELRLFGVYTTPEGDSLTYDDAVKLADYWELPNAFEAKLQVERKLILSNPEGVEEALRVS